MVRLLPCRHRLFIGFVSTRLLILWMAVCCSITPVHAQNQVDHQASGVTLTDQFGHQTTLHFPQRATVALLFSDRHSRSLAGPWVKP
ncbi:hypothetical protein [uncultured Spirosoma sp.]|uniref:hypothetical protein n=1 Tax=uncultured Spirosoma sp. TaxID=278208 RepID=UPI0025908AFD|nr:hypothetical protein [uncultured Spirosoma sp.]